ncbi:MAG: hypothetical protein J6C16_01805 [Clostridia bacterium]|nr:hypothetical protein [Clostridia bacterium]
MYKYETHLHTLPISKCAISDAESSLKFYKDMDYDGVFITNHFGFKNVGLDGVTYESKVNTFFDDVEKSQEIGERIGLKVFSGFEMGDHGADFLVYGIGREFFLKNADFMNLDILDKLTLMKEAGGLIIHAHPFRQLKSKRSIRIFPYHVEGVEVYNTNREGQGTELAAMYAKHYELSEFAGSDNHSAEEHPLLGGMQSETPIINEQDFIEKYRAGKLNTFCEKNPFIYME